MAYDLMECLEAIDPGSCDYTEWVQVGMALKAEGYEWQIWDEWSRKDDARYHAGECERKWSSFSEAERSNNVTGGTLVEFAKQSGWEPPERDLGEELDWEGFVVDNGSENRPREPRQPKNYEPAYKIIDPTWIEGAEIEEPDQNWCGWRDLVSYIEVLFSSEEIVGYVVESWNKDGKWIPSR